MKFTGILLVGLVLASGAGGEGERLGVGNGVVEVGVSKRDAGAVCSLVYDGMEFVNDHDHGRQLQVAWSYNDLDEAYNPTEAGAGEDGGGERSSSELVSWGAEGNRLGTVSHPAYWRRPGEGERRKNTAAVTKDTLRKEIRLGYKEDGHVVVVDTTIEISRELTGPAVTSMRVEAPTLYANAGLSEHYLLDLSSGEMKAVAVRGKAKDRMNERIGRVTRREVVPIMSTADGRHAVAFYTPQEKDFWAYYTWDVPSDEAKNASEKIAVFFKHGAESGRSYSYRTFVVVGDLATVKASVGKLRER